MNNSKWGALVVALVLLVTYNLAQPDLYRMRTNPTYYPGTKRAEGYGPSMLWLDRLMKAEKTGASQYVKLDFRILSSMMIAGLASGFKSQVANLLWMRSDEYWHSGLATRQVSLMEIVVTLDPQFIDAWSTAGWNWAYNIYADIELSDQYKNRPQRMRQEQDKAVLIGVDYLRRGAEMNPDTYRLWFEDAWTWAYKWGSCHPNVIALLNEAHKQKDVRSVEKSVWDPATKQYHTKMVEGVGLDTVQHTIGHIYEETPDIEKALDTWAKGIPFKKGQEQRQRKLLENIGIYWRRYGTNYLQIEQIYHQGTPEVQAQIRKLVPDIQQLMEANDTRSELEGEDSTPLGAYVTICARYLPTWNLMKQGKLDDAIKLITGVMKADPKYHLTDLKTLEEIFALRGDSKIAIKSKIDNMVKEEESSSQEIGLHFLAMLYQMKADRLQKAGKQAEALTNYHLAYDTWYRGRVRNELDFYAKRQTYIMQDRFGFPEPTAIKRAIDRSRMQGNPNGLSGEDMMPKLGSEKHVLPEQLEGLKVVPHDVVPPAP
jgi:hypothetical protein